MPWHAAIRAAVLGCAGSLLAACGPSASVDAGDAAIDAGHDSPSSTDAFDVAEIADAAIDVMHAEDTPGDTVSEPFDATPSVDAIADGTSDANDASACVIIGMACNPSSSTDCPSSAGFACFGLVPDAGAQGVCLASYLTRTICGDGSHHCSSSAERCLLSYHFCLFSYEVPCVCDPYPAACGPP